MWIVFRGDKMNSKRFFIGVLLLFISLVVFLLFPRKRELLDGGTIRYESCGWGALYMIEYRHCLCYETGRTYYEIGTLITVLGTELYNDIHIDYDNPINAEPSPEDINELNIAIESAMNK